MVQQLARGWGVLLLQQRDGPKESASPFSSLHTLQEVGKHSQCSTGDMVETLVLAVKLPAFLTGGC